MVTGVASSLHIVSSKRHSLRSSCHDSELADFDHPPPPLKSLARGVYLSTPQKLARLGLFQRDSVGLPDDDEVMLNVLRCQLTY